MNILGKSIILRAIEEDDLTMLQQWASDPAIQGATGRIHFPSSKRFHAHWLETNGNADNHQRWIVQSMHGEAIGLTSLINIDWRNRNAWHGILIGNANYHGAQFAADAIFATMRYAFEELQLERLDGSVIEYNDRSLKLYCSKILGWEVEGKRRRYTFHKGRYWDQILIGITRERFEEVKPVALQILKHSSG